jgi:hypothetical protein
LNISGISLSFYFFLPSERPMRITYSTSPAVLTAIAQTRLQPRAARGSNTRGARGGRGGRGGGRKSTAQPKKSQEELDAEMDNYMQAPPVSDLCDKRTTKVQVI